MSSFGSKYQRKYCKDFCPESFYSFLINDFKVEKILKGSLNSIFSPSLKIQIMGGKNCLMCKGKTLLGVVNKLLKIKQTFPPIVRIFTDGEGDGIEYRLSS